MSRTTKHERVGEYQGWVMEKVYGHRLKKGEEGFTFIHWSAHNPNDPANDIIARSRKILIEQIDQEIERLASRYDDEHDNPQESSNPKEATDVQR
jgi:hypothetical protein